MVRSLRDAALPSNLIYWGQLKRDEILVKSKIVARIPMYSNDYYGLNDTKFYGLRLENIDNNATTRAFYWEVRLNGKSESEAIMFEFEFMFDARLISFRVCFLTDLFLKNKVMYHIHYMLFFNINPKVHKNQQKSFYVFKEKI